MKNTKRILLAAVAALLLVAVSVGGTLAWLTASTQTITNTFTTSDISITLTETTGTEYKMVPGATIDKDPKVTVATDSEPCYLFVKIDESQNLGTFISYEVADGWTKLDGVADIVYYRTASAGNEFSILAKDQVTVKDGVTKEMMHPITGTFSNPTLTFTAYAVQSANLPTGMTMEQIWALAQTAGSAN